MLADKSSGVVRFRTTTCFLSLCLPSRIPYHAFGHHASFEFKLFPDVGHLLPCCSCCSGLASLSVPTKPSLTFCPVRWMYEWEWVSLVTLPVIEKRYQPLRWSTVALRSVREVEHPSLDTVAVSTERTSDSACTMIVVKAEVPFQVQVASPAEGAHVLLETREPYCDAQQLIRL